MATWANQRTAAWRFATIVVRLVFGNQLKIDTDRLGFDREFLLTGLSRCSVYFIEISMPSRKHEGCRRSSYSHQAILKAALALTQKKGVKMTSIEAIAARAGVGKQTIYRWWPSLGAVIFDAYLEILKNRIGWSETGDLVRDLADQLQRVLALLQDKKFGVPIANLVAEAQRDSILAATMKEKITLPYRQATLARLRAAQDRGELSRSIDLDLFADALFAPVWMRLLLGVADLNAIDPKKHVQQLLNGARSSG